MPCYDTPPEWEGKARRNAEEAVRILCETIGMLIRAGLTPVRRDLQWYLEHREIDLEIAESSYYKRPEPQKAAEIRADIAMVRDMLAKMKG